MNSKIDKIARDIKKTRARIANDQARLKELERQKVDLENTEIITLFRTVNVPPKDVAEMIKTMKNGELRIENEGIRFADDSKTFATGDTTIHNSSILNSQLERDDTDV